MKVYRGGGGIAPCILNLCTRWRYFKAPFFLIQYRKFYRI